MLKEERIKHWLSVGAQPTDRVLRFTDGRTYKLKSAYPVRPEMIWEDENGKALVRINGIFGFGERSGGVDVVEDLVHSPSDDNALLVSLGWYLMVSSYLDMALVL